MSVFTLDILEQELSGAKKVGIAGHIRPDGDCIGSCTALYQYLIQIRHELGIEQVHVYLEPFGQEFHILSGTDKIRHTFDFDDTYDVFITLDCSSIDRLGNSIRYFESAKRTICIDHHITNDKFADMNHVIADASSTCEVLYDLLDDDRINREIARSLYTGIVHDTGMFKHSNTTYKTMAATANLLRKGIDFTNIIDVTFVQKTYAQLQILGRCLMESRLLMDGKVIFSSVNQKTLQLYDLSCSDLDGIIDNLRTAKGCEVAIFIYETGKGEYKISMRSNGIVDVSKIVHLFGGGGHIKAAGCTMKGTDDDIINNLIPHIAKQLNAAEE